MNPFLTGGSIKTPPPHINDILNLNKEEKKEETKSNDFLTGLRDFMNDFAETDLNIDSIEEPVAMSKAQANFYVKLYNQILENEKEINELCDRELEMNKTAINLYREKALAEQASKKEYFLSILKQFAEGELEGKKTRTIKLPYGNLSFKKQQPKYLYDDEEKIKEYLNENKPEFLKVKTTCDINKAEIKKAGTYEDGVFKIGELIIPGITVQAQDDKFEVK